MRMNLLLFAMSVGAAWGQAEADVSRVFVFHHVETTRDLQELGTMIRTVAEMRDLTVDNAQMSMSLHGAPERIAIAEWLYTELDRQTLPPFATKPFQVANNEDDVVRLFFLPNTPTVQDFQEMATAMRAVTDIRRVFTYNSRRALAARGTADQIAAAEFLIRELDQPATAKRADSRVLQMIDTSKFPETAVRVFYLPYASTLQQFQEVATLLRTIGDIRRVFTCNTPKAIVVRGDAEEMAFADWMIHELAKPVTAESAASKTYQYVDPTNHGESVVRVYYVKDATTVAAVQQLATNIRIATMIRRMFTYSSSKAIALRGTANQIAMAEQILHDRQMASK